MDTTWLTSPTVRVVNVVRYPGPKLLVLFKRRVAGSISPMGRLAVFILLSHLLTENPTSCAFNSNCRGGGREKANAINTSPITQPYPYYLASSLLPDVSHSLLPTLMLYIRDH